MKPESITQRLHSSSFLGLPSRILKYEPQKGTTMEPLGTCNYALDLPSGIALRAPQLEAARNPETTLNKNTASSNHATTSGSNKKRLNKSLLRY